MISKIDALAEVARDQTRSQEERDASLLALRDIAANVSTAHERETAAYVLKTLTANTTGDEYYPLTDELLCLLYLPENFIGDPEQVQRARLAFWKWELKKNDLSEQKRELALTRIRELENEQHG